MIQITAKGSTAKTEKFLAAILRGDQYAALASYGQRLTDALAAATPIESGKTAESWVCKIDKKGGRYALTVYNTNVIDGVPVAILLQYGHGTGTGGWVQGRDYINPAIKPIFDSITEDVWEKVKRG